MVKVNDSVNKENALNSFERKIIESFASAQMNSDDFFRKDKTIMFGVSGGADSVAMLIAFTEIRKKLFSDKSPEFYVVSIDHSIRPSEESAGDARYVQELCRKLDVECQVVHFPEGLVSGIASERMKGIEEAARFLRYQSFEQIAKEHNASLFCLAHNRNDQLETLLMRFLQGSDTSSSVGIPRKRGIFYRPMLDISRDEIEDYLLQHQIEYKTDSTNSDESYLRNRIRNTLIPVISQSFPGWDKAVLSGVEKKIEDNYALEQVIHNLDWDKGLNKKGNPYISVDARQFYEMLPAFRRRFIYKGLTILEVQNRIPYKVIKNAIYAIKNNSDTIPLFSFFSTNLNFYCDGERLFIEEERNKKEDILNGLYSVINEPGIYKFSFGNLRAVEISSFQENKNVFQCPVIVRTPVVSDSIINKGKKENLMDYLSSFGVNKEVRNSIPVLESYGCDSVFLIPGYFDKSNAGCICNFQTEEKNAEKKFLIIEMISEDL